MCQAGRVAVPTSRQGWKRGAGRRDAATGPPGGTPGQMGETESLRRVIQDRHDVWCTFIRQESVREATWSGKVHVFSCTDHPAMLVYAWAEKAAGAERVVT